MPVVARAAPAPAVRPMLSSRLRSAARAVPALRAAGDKLSVRCMASRPRKAHDESASGEVHVETHKTEPQQAQEGAAPAQGSSADTSMAAPRGRARRGGLAAQSAGAGGGVAPWASLGGGLASVLPRMMLSSPSGGLLASDPFALMSPSALLRSGGPFGVADRLLHELEDEMRGLFGEAAQQQQEGEEGALAIPDVGRLWAAVDVKETPQEFILATDVPGVRKEDVKITVEDGVLFITGERKQEQVKEEEGFKRVERSFGSFERRFKVPSNADADAIKADMEHGVLEVHIPKREEAKPKAVNIAVGGGEAGKKGAGAGGQKAMEG